MSKVYLTGSSGFIGSNMVKYLAGKGNEVLSFKRPIDEAFWKIKVDQSFEFIHLSAYGNHNSQRDLAKTLRANISDLLHITTFLSGIATCSKLYNISTSSIQLPKQTLYSASKHLGELMVESYNDPRFVNVRPYSVYGPGEADHRFIPTVIRALHSGETIQLDEHASHDWIYVDDFIKAMFDGYTNIGTGKSYTNLDIVWMLEHISGKKLNYQPAKMRSYDTANWVCPDGVPHRDIMEGLKLTYESFTR